ncbi:MAG: hypothetical protein UHU19_14815 [Lachnospiraceae bacterium]|nr:hypothetical protein [Lachnospiraceae bacterium]
MTEEILKWLLEDSTPEVKLRTLKEYLKLPDNHEDVILAKEVLKKSKIYASILRKLKKDDKWITLYAYMAKNDSVK